MDNIKVIDDSFDPLTLKILNDKIPLLQWGFHEVISESDGHPVERFMTNNVYEEQELDSDPQVVLPLIDRVCQMQLANIFPNIKQNGLKRLRFNGTFAGDGYKMYPHADIHGDQDSVWTIVIFLNDSDGGTSFYTDKGKTKVKTVDFKQNRAVIFPSKVWHNAESPTKTYWRVTIGACYMFETN